MRKIRLIAIIILIAVSLSACGGSSSSSSSSDRYSGYVGDYYSDSVADNEMLSYRYHVSIEMLSTKTAPINIEDTYETIMDDCYRLGGYLLEKDADYYDTRDSESEVLYSGQIRITIDIPDGKLTMDVSDEELEERRKTLKEHDNGYHKGYLARYSRMVGSAAGGAVIE